MRKIIYLLIALGSTLLAFMSNLPSTSSNSFINWLIDNKLTICIIVAIIVLISQVVEWIWGEEHIIKQWTKNFLRFIAKEHLGGGEYQTRISILRPQRGYIFIFKYLWFSFVVNFINNFKYHNWMKVIKNIPVHLLSDYLTVFVRYSYPKEERSVTYFRVSNRNESLNGVADKCYKEGREIEVCTCDISSVTLPACYADIKKSRIGNNKSIKKYMDDSYISEENYSSLVNMNTKANNLYSLAITNKKEEIWGVLIIDNVGTDKRSFKDELKDVIGDYAKIFCFTLSTLK